MPDFHTDHLSGSEQLLSESVGAYRKSHVGEAHHHHTIASGFLSVSSSSFSHGHGIVSGEHQTPLDAVLVYNWGMCLCVCVHTHVCKPWSPLSIAFQEPSTLVFWDPQNLSLGPKGLKACDPHLKSLSWPPWLWGTAFFVGVRNQTLVFMLGKHLSLTYWVISSVCRYWF